MLPIIVIFSKLFEVIFEGKKLLYLEEVVGLIFFHIPSIICLILCV